MKKETLFIRYCIAGLNNMYFESENVFSASYKCNNGIMLNHRDRDHEYRYTMNTLLGLHKAQTSGYSLSIDVESSYRSLSSQIQKQSISSENIAATVWTGKTLCMAVPSEAMSLFNAIAKESSVWQSLTAQAIAWMIYACIECGGNHLKDAIRLALHASRFYIHRESCLVRHVPSGFRSSWASFAASCYMAHAFLILGRKTEDENIKEMGLGIARKLVSLQGPLGQWAWFYDVQAGRVADYYPVYSVHQHSMAPFFLLEAIDQGYSEFREPLLKGFRWVLGQNEFHQKMAESTYYVMWRGVKRREPLNKFARFARAMGVKFMGTKSGTENKDMLQIIKECRSYELGWALWAFSGRNDFDEILNDPSFR
jgi:hypothetical protein